MPKLHRGRGYGRKMTRPYQLLHAECLMLIIIKIKINGLRRWLWTITQQISNYDNGKNTVHKE